MTRIFVILLVCLFSLPSVADDVVAVDNNDDAAPAVTVTSRKTCTEQKAEIDKLTADEGADKKTLDVLQATYRAQCVKHTSGRRGHVAYMAVTSAGGDKTAMTADAIKDFIADTVEKCKSLKDAIDAGGDVDADVKAQYDQLCAAPSDDKSDADDTAVAVTEEFPEHELTDEEIDAFLAAGLCGDGSAPNRYGCCVNEVFRDMGNATFACCPRSGGDCFPPIGK